MMKKFLLLFFMGVISSAYTAEKNPQIAEVCHSTLNEQIQGLREARLAMAEALEKENRFMFESANIELDYALEVLSENLLDSQIERQASLIKPCQDSQQIKSALQIEAFIDLEKKAKCHRQINVANIYYQSFLKSKTNTDKKSYVSALNIVLKDNHCSNKVKDRIKASIKRGQK